MIPRFLWRLAFVLVVTVGFSDRASAQMGGTDCYVCRNDGTMDAECAQASPAEEGFRSCTASGFGCSFGYAKCAGMVTRNDRVLPSGRVQFDAWNWSANSALAVSVRPVRAEGCTGVISRREYSVSRAKVLRRAQERLRV